MNKIIGKFDTLVDHFAVTNTEETTKNLQENISLLRDYNWNSELAIMASTVKKYILDEHISNQVMLLIAKQAEDIDQNLNEKEQLAHYLEYIAYTETFDIDTGFSDEQREQIKKELFALICENTIDISQPS